MFLLAFGFRLPAQVGLGRASAQDWVPRRFLTFGYFFSLLSVWIYSFMYWLVGLED
jgi:hypothetical protein